MASLRGRVSILVFVELALELYLKVLRHNEGVAEFQSLFLWNWRSNLIAFSSEEH